MSGILILSWLCWRGVVLKVVLEVVEVMEAAVVEVVEVEVVVVISLQRETAGYQ